jgi:iron-sulfur cluster assembly protein
MPGLHVDTGGRGGTKTMITLTDRAVQEVRQIIQEKKLPEGSLLRLGVAGGGCSGFEYMLDFCDRANEGDEITESRGIRIVVDRKSLLYLQGLEIDFNDSLLNRGFKFRNPNAKGTCGCGTSFSV